MAKIYEYYKASQSLFCQDWKFRIYEGRVSLPELFIPKNIIQHLENVGLQIVSQYEEELKKAKGNLEREIDNSWKEILINDPFFEKPFSGEVVLEPPKEYVDKFGSRIINSISIPEFFISFRGRKESNRYFVEGLLFPESSAEFTIYGDVGKCKKYNKEEPIPEIFFGHSHAPNGTPRLSEGDLGLFLTGPTHPDTIPVGDVTYLFNTTPQRNPSHKFFYRIDRNRFAQITYKTTSEKDFTKVIPKVRIQRRNIRGVLPNKKAVNIAYFVTNVKFVRSR